MRDMTTSLNVDDPTVTIRLTQAPEPDTRNYGERMNLSIEEAEPLREAGRRDHPGQGRARGVEGEPAVKNLLEALNVLTWYLIGAGAYEVRWAYAAIGVWVARAVVLFFVLRHEAKALK